MPRFNVEIPVTSEFTRWSWFKIHVAGAAAPNGFVWIARLALWRLKMKVHVGSRTETIRIRTTVTFEDIEEFMPLPVWSPK